MKSNFAVQSNWLLGKNINQRKYLSGSLVKFLSREGGVVAEWSKALLVRENRRKNKKDPRFAPRPLKKKFLSRGFQSRQKYSNLPTSKQILLKLKKPRFLHNERADCSLAKSVSLQVAAIDLTIACCVLPQRKILNVGNLLPSYGFGLE